MTLPRGSKRPASVRRRSPQLAVELVVELACPFEDFTGPVASELMWALRALRPVLDGSPSGRVRLSVCVCAYDVADAVRIALGAVRASTKIPVAFVHTQRMASPRIAPALASA